MYSLGDIIDTARNLVSGCTGRLGCTCYKSLRIKPIDEIESKYFLRMAVEDRPGVLLFFVPCACFILFLYKNGISLRCILLLL